jgi:hypothetical protein
MIARTGNRLHHRWAVIAGQGDEAYVFRYASTRGWAEYYAEQHPTNCQEAQVCPECGGAKILLSGTGGFDVWGDECACCSAQGVVYDPYPWARQEIDFAGVNPLLPAVA